MITDEGRVSDKDECGGLNEIERSCARLVLSDTYIHTNQRRDKLELLKHCLNHSTRRNSKPSFLFI